MRLHCFSVISLILASAVFSASSQANAHPQALSASRCLSTSVSGRWLTAASTNSCPGFRVAPAYTNASEAHEFELFNNSYRDVLFLHLTPLDAPDQEMVFGGTRKLAPGRAWSVDLSDGCHYNLFVEYEDGPQDFYEAVNTCDHRGIQLR